MKPSDQILVMINDVLDFISLYGDKLNESQLRKFSEHLKYLSNFLYEFGLHDIVKGNQEHPDKDA